MRVLGKIVTAGQGWGLVFEGLFGFSTRLSGGKLWEISSRHFDLCARGKIVF